MGMKKPKRCSGGTGESGSTEEKVVSYKRKLNREMLEKYEGGTDHWIA